ncbi:Bestrophin, RFP-TM, chloride channel-domain-containing protein [Fusarium redolens]|uniref:Bestrophin, RFP-TM, chloride channel-domain-containing protein n=1 Tax=Fusarium redolens TaxID=48865 RepID=A0A9P9HD63_FUSRE|nr:Bestrophin, RFP-TM, chloride channel-domain-containing protein [Fusarium redolens]KAH7255066.1 Bestrophin, RFP-TM, chloride channel-domain-containing protein [Fusarium redolens]
MSDAGGDHVSQSKPYPEAQIRERISGPGNSSNHHNCPPSPSINANRQPISSDGEDNNYFSGPRDLQRHSKWPLILQLHGSIMPSLILPLLLVACWATAITVISKKVHDLSVNSVLLTILGFVVGLSLSFRSSTAYERYAEGRRYWGTLATASQTLGRIIWIHADDSSPGGRDPRELLIKKLGALKLIAGYAVALKHTLRFEHCASQPDMQPYIAHLDTFAGKTTAPTKQVTNFSKFAGEYLGLSFAQSDPRKHLKRAEEHQGNLPLEILNHLAMALDSIIANKQLPVSIHQTIAYNHLTSLNDVAVGCDRVLNTPLPIAYTIAISQITFVYVMLLPFQLTGPLGWIAIPATITAAYIIFGLLFIGQEIENPFGRDVNDLPLDVFCEQIANDLDITASFDRHASDHFLLGGAPLHPVSCAVGHTWMDRSEEKLRESIRNKPHVLFSWRRQGGLRLSARDNKTKEVDRDMV